MKKYYSAKYEPVFLNSVVNQERVSKSVIEDVIEMDIEDITILSEKLTKDRLSIKSHNVDILVKTNQGYINIELNTNYNNSIVNRNIAYACKVLANGIKKGRTLKEIPKTIQINFNFNLGGKVGNHVYQLRDKNSNKTLSDILTIYDIDVDSYKKIVYNNNCKLNLRGIYIAMLDLEEEKLKELSKENEIVEEFYKNVKEMNDDEEFVQLMDYEEEAKLWEITNKEIAEEEGMKKGLEKGIKEGIIEGVKEGIIKTAREMLKDKVDVNTISKYTGLNIEEINKLN